MSELSCAIGFLDSSPNGKISKVTINGTHDYYSISDVSSPINYYTQLEFVYKRQDTIPFLIGSSKIGGIDGLINKYPGYCGLMLSNSSNYILIEGTSIKKLYIYFNKKHYPTKMNINGSNIHNNSPYFEIEFSSPYSSVSINILEMSTESPLLLISQITIDDVLYFTSKKDIYGASIGSRETSNLDSLDFGLISNYGEINIYDFDNKIENLSNENKISNNNVVKVYLNNKIVGLYKTEDWQYNDDNSVNIKLTSDIDKWNDIYTEIKCSVENQNAYNLFQYLSSVSNYSHGYDLDLDMINYLKSINIPYLYIDRDTLFNQWNKFCKLCMIRMYPLEDGTLKLKKVV